MENLVFANIPHNATDEDFRAWLEQRGFKVMGMRLIRDAVSGSSPSFARVELDTLDTAAVNTLDQQAFGNRRLLVRRRRSPLDD